MNLDKVKYLPDEISKDEYVKVRRSYQSKYHEYEDWYIGAIGFLASYNGKFFGGFAGKVHTKIGTVRNYYDEAKRNLQSQIPNLQDIQWDTKDYLTLDENLCKTMIYCDIPYKGTTGYEINFNHDTFWEWAKKMSKNNIVLVSEEQAPEEWKILWQHDVKRTLDNASRTQATEKLYILSNN